MCQKKMMLKDLFDIVIKKFKKVDVLICNAGFGRFANLS